MRPTSHPTGYAPQQTAIEPGVDNTQQGPGSAAGSPHIGSVGWASPGPAGSPTQSPNGNTYIYPDPESYPTGTAMGQMFYSNTAATTRRPDSAEPGAGAGRQGELWANAQ